MSTKPRFPSYIQIKMTPKDKELLEKTAEARSTSISEIVRGLIRTLEETD